MSDRCVHTRSGDLRLHSTIQSRSPRAEDVDGSCAVLYANCVRGVVHKLEFDRVVSLALLFNPDAVLIVDGGD